MNQNISKGSLIVLISYIIWGFLTLFWSLLEEVNSLYILAQRIAWSMILMAAYISVRSGWDEIKTVFQNKKHLITCFVSGVLVTINWGMYIYAVTNGHVLDSSLGYFIEPILVALTGLLLFKETMSKAEKLTFVFAFAAVVYLIAVTRTIPTIALVIALSFCAYGAVKKKLVISPQASLFMETLFMTPFALIVIVYMELNGTGSIGILHGWKFLLLPVCGLVTSLPLLLFNIGVKQIPYYIAGIIMYVSPTITFILGLVYFHETLDFHRLIAFVLIWIGIAITVGEKCKLMKTNAQ